MRALAADTARKVAALEGRVWVVDDSPMQTERAGRLLSAHYDIETFLEGGSLLERLSDGELPDLILLDWQMPGVSGLDVCVFLRERYDEVTLPILMLTARGSKTDFAEGVLAGANDYVPKPFRFASVASVGIGFRYQRPHAVHSTIRKPWWVVCGRKSSAPHSGHGRASAAPGRRS